MTQARFPRADLPVAETPLVTGGQGYAGLTLAALGIVYGDIGTSPLYAMDQIIGLGEHGGVPPVLGACSLVFWTLTLIVAVKYALLVLRAQHDGEGGVFALYAMLHGGPERRHRWLLWSLLLGAGLLLGDGMITPAISVLSAVEGLRVAAPAAGALVTPITLGLLFGLFAIQYKGTGGIGRVFGPILLLWFVVIALLGAHQIAAAPAILAAVDPRYGWNFLHAVGFGRALLVLGGLMLVVTGGEAMYADVGHFGSGPIRTGWFGLVYPALLLNYFGQGAFLLAGGHALDGRLFFSLVPTSGMFAMVLLATAATVIASQAMISGAFSLVAQAVRLGLFPRLAILHTHDAHAGQIYVPMVNRVLLAGCFALVLGFGSSSALAAAYGLAVSGVMLITSLAMFPVAREHWSWRRVPSHLVWGGFSLINGAFLASSSLKFLQGGWVPLGVGLLAFGLMAAWRWGRKATAQAFHDRSRWTMAEVVARHRSAAAFVERNAVLMSPRTLNNPDDAAPALLHMLFDRWGMLPRNLIFVEVLHPKVPYVHDNRYQVTVFERSREHGCVIAVSLAFGYMEEPNVERFLDGLAHLQEIDLPGDRRQWTVHVAHEHLVPNPHLGWLGRQRLRLFTFLRNVSRPSYAYYGLGDQVQLSVEILPVRVR